MEKKIPFFKKIIISIKDIDKYSLLISEKVMRAILYLLEIMLIFTLIVSGVMTYETDKLISEGLQYVENNVPDFTIDKEGLKLENEGAYQVENEDLEIKIVMDDEAEEIDSYNDQIEEYKGNFVLLLKNKMVIISEDNNIKESDNDISEKSKIEKSYNDLLNSNEIESITKSNIISIFNENKTQINSLIYLSVFGTTYFIYTVSTALDALVLSLLVIIISKMAKISLSYSQSLTIAISSLTLPIILNLIYTCVNLVNGFTMPHFQLMYGLVSYVYVVAVVLILRSDLIKKKQLIKATIEIKELEKQMENREEKKEDEEEQDNKDNEEKDNNKDTKGKNKLDDVKGKIEGKENPNPQANIEGGK